MTSPALAKKRLGQANTFLNKYYKSPDFNMTVFQAMKADLQAQLDIRDLTTPPRQMAACGFQFDLSRGDLERLFGRPEVEPNDRYRERLVDWLEDGATQVRKGNWQYRCGEANFELTNKGWFPFFVTLTMGDELSPYDSREELLKSRELEIYRRKLCDVAIRACGVKVTHGRKTPSDFFQYAMVIEHGQSREHHHVHMLCWMRDVPAEWKRDPNQALDVPRYSRCLAGEAFWPWGFSTFEYFRFIGDPWSRLGFRVPVKITKLHTVFDAGVYLCKYLTKESKEWLHRMKATRGLGLSTLKAFLETMPSEMLTVLERLPKNYTSIRNYSENARVPMSLARQLIRVELWERKWISPQRILLSQMTTPLIFLEMLKSVGPCLQPWRLSLPERYDWLLACLGPERQAPSDEWEEFAGYLIAEFPATQRVSATTLHEV